MGALLFELVNSLLLLIDLVSEPGQLPVVSLPVTLHLHLQRLLQTAHPPRFEATLPDAHPKSAPVLSGHLPTHPTLGQHLAHSPSLHLLPGCPAPCPSRPPHARFLGERHPIPDWPPLESPGVGPRAQVGQGSQWAGLWAIPGQDSPF